MKKKTLAAAVCISAVLLLASCGKDTNTSVPASQNVMSSSSSEVLPQYSAEQSAPTSSQTESKPEQTEIDWSAVPIIAETELEYVDNGDGTVTVTKYLGSEKVLNYPSEIDGKKVIDIDPPENCTAVKLPDSMTELGNYMFYERTKLETVVIPDSVTRIGDKVFASCYSLKSVTLPKNLTQLGLAVFQRCSKLTEIVIPNGVTRIYQHVFDRCNSLESITIPNGVKTIDIYAFCDCFNLKSIDLPDSVTNICKNAFITCSEELTINYKGKSYSGKSIEELYDKDLSKM